MKFIILVLLGFGTFDVSLSEGLMQFFVNWFADIINDSAEDDFINLFSDFYGDYGDYGGSDSSTEGSHGQGQLPGGPNWLENMHLVPPKPSSLPPQYPGQQQQQQQQQPSSGSNFGQPPPFPTLSTPLPYSSSSSPPQEQQQVQQVTDLLANAKPIPMAPPTASTSIPAIPLASSTSADSLILALPSDNVNNADGQGVLDG